MALASYDFLLGLFPLSLLLVHVAARIGQPTHSSARGRQLALLVVSLVFCLAGGAASLVYLVGSSAFTFGLSRVIERASTSQRPTGLLLSLGIGGNLLGLACFKYSTFVSENIELLFDSPIDLPSLALPLGISFITFQQLSYLVDASRGATRDYDWLDYGSFVSFFPKLVAGPLADAKPLIGQLRAPRAAEAKTHDLGLGLTLLVAGLFKKVMIADELGECADPIFAAAASGAPLATADAWFGALAYTLQIYFDFSGYSDMAIGAARTLGVRLPQNFDSPYQAINIADFWRRWHITLGRFLTRQLYTPIATPLTRRAFARGAGGAQIFLTTVAAPTLVTFALAGLWHGAGWTFVCFGLLHGIYLTSQEGWRELRRHWLGKPAPSRVRDLGSWALTFMAVLVAFVFFRAGSVAEALHLLSSMVGLANLQDPGAPSLELLTARRDMLLLLATAPIAWLCPNVAQLLREHGPTLEPARSSTPLGTSWSLMPSPMLALITALVAIASITALGEASGFIYYQF